jgi:glutaconate CoA-transferase subunit A
MALRGRPDADGAKLVDADTAIARLSGAVDVLALGGMGLENRACTLVRAAVRAGLRCRVLTSAPVASWDADVLLLAGLAERLRIPHVSLGDAGLAPGVREAARAGLVFEAVDEALLIGGLLAGVEDTPFQVLHKLGSNDIIDDNPLVGREGALHTTPACRPDAVFLHAALGDAQGNLAHLGSRFADLLLAQAAQRVYAQVDALVPTSVVRRVGVSVPGHLVDAVVPAR